MIVKIIQIAQLFPKYLAEKDIDNLMVEVYEVELLKVLPSF